MQSVCVEALVPELSWHGRGLRIKQGRDLSRGEALLYLVLRGECALHASFKWEECTAAVCNSSCLQLQLSVTPAVCNSSCLQLQLSVTSAVCNSSCLQLQLYVTPAVCNSSCLQLQLCVGLIQNTSAALGWLGPRTCEQWLMSSSIV
jgi:hypothetical protein